MYFEVDHSGQRADLAKSVHHCLGVPQSPSQSGRAGREKGTSLNSTCLTPKPLAPSVYVHVLEVPSPQERSISVMSLFPYPSDLPTDSARAAVRLASSSLSLPCWLAHRSSKLHRLTNQNHRYGRDRFRGSPGRASAAHTIDRKAPPASWRALETKILLQFFTTSTFKKTDGHPRRRQFTHFDRLELGSRLRGGSPYVRLEILTTRRPDPR